MQNNRPEELGQWEDSAGALPPSLCCLSTVILLCISASRTAAPFAPPPQGLLERNMLRSRTWHLAAKTRKMVINDEFHRIWPISEPNAREKHGESDFRVQFCLAGQFGAQLGPLGGSLGVLFSPYMEGTHNYGF